MDNNNNNIDNEESQLLPMLNLCWAQFKAYWGWFLISVVVCLVAGYVYLQRQDRVYQRQAVILIEDADPSAGMGGTRPRRAGGAMSSLMELNGISVGDNLKNEIFILGSRRLMGRVVDTLGLEVDYTMGQSLHSVALYRNRPFSVEFSGRCLEPESFVAECTGKRTFSLSDFRRKGDKLSGSVDIKAGESRNTPLGRLTMRPDACIDSIAPGEKVTVTRVPRDMATAIYCSRIGVSEYDKESSLIVLSCNDVNPDRAEDVINELYEAYKRDIVENKNNVARHTAEFIDERIRLIDGERIASADELARFMSANGLTDFEQSAQLSLSENSVARKERLALETEVTVSRYLMQFLRDNSRNTETIPVLSLPNASFTPLVTEYNKQMLDRNRLAANSSDNSPAVREMDSRLASLRTSVLNSVQSYVKSLELQLGDAGTNEALLRRKVGSLPEKQKQGLDIKQQLELKNTLYTYMLNKREEVALQMAISEANVRLVEPPLGANMPVSPRGKIIFLVSLLVGLVLPAAILWLRHMFDTTISGRKDVETATTIPIAGEIPHWDKGGEQTIVNNEESNSPIMEAFRVLRYGLNFMRHSARVYVVTSATPGQGKSFISTNMAYILSRANKRVLLIDADIRKRTVTHMLGRGQGLTAMLADEESAVDLAAHVLPDVKNLGFDFLPAGKMPPNPSELLMSDRLDDIIEEAKKQYDYIVVDTTPALSVSDAGVVNRVADLTVFVLRVGVQARSFLPELEKMYQSRRFRNLSVVINDSDAKRGYYAGYSYGYGYEEHRPRKRGFRLFGRKK